MGSSLTDQRPPAPRLWTPRLVATLALLVICAVLFCIAGGYALVRQADDHESLERRAALLGAVEDIRKSGADFSALDPRYIKAIERIVGVKDLRFETEPSAVADTENREIQSVVDRQGRIAGFFSWQTDHSMSNALGQLRPLIIVTGVFLVGFAVIALWQVRRALRDLSASERLAWTLAYEDVLTGLPNQRKMIDTIDGTLTARPPGEVVTLAFFDLDGLQDINSAFGHRAGDDLLKSVASRLRELLPAGAACGRFDGDQFALVTTTPDGEAARAAVESLTAALMRPFWIKDRVVQAGITAGYVQAPHDAASRDDLMRRADLTLRAAKKSHRGTATAFTAAIEIEFDERRFLEKELGRALDEAAFEVHYQPIVTADGGRIVGAEALLRWTHPSRGQIVPATFVPVAEQCGLMPRLGEFVLARALADAARWPDLGIAVNLSPVQVRDPALVDTISALLREHGIPASRLTLEVTEGVLMDNPDEAKARLGRLKALGVQLALDDFGTGYSSLSYLQRFNFDKLKIDRGFVEPLSRDQSSNALVQAIVALGRALDLTLLAEGVETEEQRVRLRLAGCQEMQGFLFARPGPREELDRLVADASPLRAAVA
jgi:diguanylate cyclase (GGDEF)-like protein